MKTAKFMKFIKHIFSFGLVLMFWGGSFDAAAQPKKARPQTVTDYFLLLTPEQLSPLEFVKNRRSLIKIEDTKNGYLLLSGDWEGWAEIALFRKKNREAVIGVVYVGCGPACDGAAQFLTYKNGKWTDVTAEVMPEELGDEDILAAFNRLKTRDDYDHSLEEMPATYWEMPQRGTILKLALGDPSPTNGKALLRFDWNGERFTRMK